MILVSFVELLQGGIEAIGIGPAHLAFFAGMLLIFLVDALIPHDYVAEHHRTSQETRKGRLMRTGLFTALGIGIHNFPEGMASWCSFPWMSWFRSHVPLEKST